MYRDLRSGSKIPQTSLLENFKEIDFHMTKSTI